MSHPDLPGSVTVPEREDRHGHRRARGGGSPAGSALKAGLLGFLATLAVIVVVVVAVRAGGSHSGSAASGAGHGGTSGTSGTSTPAGLTASVRAWASGGGNTHMATLARDVGAIQDDSSAGDTASMSQDCVSFQSDLRAAEIYRAVPEHDTQQHWSQALTLLAQAAADCSDGTVTHDSALVGKSADELRSGSTELDIATARVNELAGP